MVANFPDVSEVWELARDSFDGRRLRLIRWKMEEELVVGVFCSTRRDGGVLAPERESPLSERSRDEREDILKLLSFLLMKLARFLVAVGLD